MEHIFVVKPLCLHERAKHKTNTAFFVLTEREEGCGGDDDRKRKTGDSPVCLPKCSYVCQLFLFLHSTLRQSMATLIYMESRKLYKREFIYTSEGSLLQILRG